MEEEDGRRDFAFKRIVFDNGKPFSYGVVIAPDGELIRPDLRIPDEYRNKSSERAFTEIWHNVLEREVAISWQWQHGRHDFQVAYLPTTVTDQQIATSQRLYQEIVGFYADEINWMDIERWRHNPTGAPGWRLRKEPVPTDDELRQTAEAIIARFEKLPDLPGERLRAGLRHADSGDWEIRIEENFGQCTLEPLLPSSIRRLVQLERDYLCHYSVVTNRQEQYNHWVENYEMYRAAIEGHGGQLINVGHDGFCVITDHSSRIYGLNEKSFKLFRQYCIELKSADIT